jgi:hypothetical protein
MSSRFADSTDDFALPLSTTREEQIAIRQRRVTLDARILRAREAQGVLENIDAESDHEWLDNLFRWRETLQHCFPPPSDYPSAYDTGLASNLTLSIAVIDTGLQVLENSVYDLSTLRLGRLMQDDGFKLIGADSRRNYAGAMEWFGSIPETEARIATIEQQRAAAESMLTEALLDDDERQRLDAEAQVRRDEANAMPTRKVRHDGSMYDKYPDGKIEEVTQ